MIVKFEILYDSTVFINRHTWVSWISFFCVVINPGLVIWNTTKWVLFSFFFFQTFNQFFSVETVSNDEGDTVLHVAVKENNVAFLEHVIRSFPLVNKANNKNHAPIHVAVLSGNFELVKVIFF